MIDGWKDVGDFELPELAGELRANGYAVQQALARLSNKLAFLAQYEPGCSDKINRCKQTLSDIDREERRLLMEGRLRRSEIPEEFRGSQEMRDSFVTMRLCKNEFEAIEKRRRLFQEELAKAESEYGRLAGKIKTLKTAIDTGRSILSAIKSDLAAERGMGDGA